MRASSHFVGRFVGCFVHLVGFSLLIVAASRSSWSASSGTSNATAPSSSSAASADALLNHKPQSQPSVGTHGGKIVKSKGRTAEVNIDKNGKSVTVYMRRGPEGNPRALEVTLFDEDQNPFTLEVKAISSPDSDVSVYQGSVEQRVQAVGAGTPSLQNQPSMGIELRIPLSSGKAKGKSEVLR